MIPFTVFDAETGAFIRSGEAEDIQIQAQPGEVVTAGHWPAETHVLRRGKARPRNTRKRAEMVMERLWREVRITRNRLLMSHVDSITALRWASLSPAQKAALKTYRQALLDIPQQQGDPRNIKWPTPPGRTGGL
jgi:Phage tail assembly chaperone protein